MRKMEQIIFLLSVFFFSVTKFGCYAQTNGLIVKGRVIDENNRGIQGIKISIKGTSVTTVSDKKGDYAIPVSDTNSILVLSFHKVSLKGSTLTRTESDINMKNSPEVVRDTITKEFKIGDKNNFDILFYGNGIKLVFWCCTDHKPPDGPHCSTDKENLKKETKCKHFKIGNE